MHSDSFTIKYDNHFKLYILLKDKIVFESELINNGVQFYIDDQQALTGNEMRYYLLDKDRPVIDKIIKDNEIIASTETIAIGDYRDQKKVMRLYLTIFAFLTIIMIIITILFK